MVVERVTTLSPEVVREIQRAVADIHRLARGHLQPTRGPGDRTADGYFVRVPSGGIAARDGATLYSALCDLYKETTGSGNTRILTAIMQGSSQAQIRVWNIWARVIPEGYYPTDRTHSGTRYVIYDDAEESSESSESSSESSSEESGSESSSVVSSSESASDSISDSLSDSASESGSASVSGSASDSAASSSEEIDPCATSTCEASVVLDGEDKVWQVSINGCAEAEGNCECPVNTGDSAADYPLGYEATFDCQTAT